jgi:hypothetical protein
MLPSCATLFVVLLTCVPPPATTGTYVGLCMCCTYSSNLHVDIDGHHAGRGAALRPPLRPALGDVSIRQRATAARAFRMQVPHTETQDQQLRERRCWVCGIPLSAEYEQLPAQKPKPKQFAAPCSGSGEGRAARPLRGYRTQHHHCHRSSTHSGTHPPTWHLRTPGLFWGK